MEPGHHHHDAPQLTDTVRSATAADVPALAALHLASWRAAYRDIVPAAWLADVTIQSRRTRWAGALAAPQAEGRQTIVIDDNGSIVALCEIGFARHPMLDAACGEVIALHVHPERTGAGLGSRLLGEATRRLIAMGCTHALLWVLRDNMPARRFYEARGWIADGAGQLERRQDVAIPEVRYRRTLWD